MGLECIHYHQVGTATAAKMADIRGHFIALGELLDERLPQGRSRSLALTALEESCMRAIQAYAVAEGVPFPAGVVITEGD